MSGKDIAGPIGQALVEFTTSGAFPEEDVSSLKLGSKELPPAIQALAEAKFKLEAEIHTINEQTAPDVSSWMTNAKSLQDDISRSKRLANDIVRQAEEPVISGGAIQEAREKVAFLQAELAYKQRVKEALTGIKEVNEILDSVEKARNERRILDALRLLEKSWAALDALPAGKSARAVRLLDLRAFELKSNVHDVFDHVWKALVNVDVEGRSISISQTRAGEAMSLSDAVIGLQAYKEVDQRMSQLWHGVDLAVIRPRTDIDNSSLPAIMKNGNVLRAEGQADKTIESLFADMDLVFSYFAERLPPDLIDSMSALMMPEVVSRIISVWLDSAVPSSLKEMDRFEQIMAIAKRFCGRLTELKFSGFNELQEWVESAPRVWLAKCRERALDKVRIRLSEGLGSPKQVERVEKQMVSRAEGQELVAAPATAAAADDDDWGAAWDDEVGQQEGATQEPEKPVQDQASLGADEDGTDAWGWADEGEAQESTDPQAQRPKQENQDDDGGEAWGWGEEDAQEQPQNETAAKPSAATPAATEQTREMTLKETYNISSMPEPVLQLIFAILEDGATLTQAGNESSPVATAAAGLLSLPTLALAMFRAVGPYYYALDVGGNMFLYNDATYLAEKLGDFAAAWKKREDLSTRAQNSLRLDNDVKTLRSFAARAYSNEMNVQKTVLRDLLGGEQSLLQQDDLEGCVDLAVSRVRSMAVTWEDILARSAWYQAVGSLVDAISLKIISDVIEAPSISQDDAYNIAKLIASVTELDDLFLQRRVTGRPASHADEQVEVPQTTQYAGSWMRLKYLGEVLQSNLRDVRFLWVESELSLYFTLDEVVDLINLSFEDNARTREVIREITANPHPRQDEQSGW